MQEITVDLGSRSYPILIGEHLLADAAVLARVIPDRPLLVVTNETVAGHYLDTLRRGLAGHRVTALSLPDGEQYKTLATAARVFDALIEAGINRDGVIVALGGGVIGDIAGFAAACYQRGIACVQVPTTLLAQVDSSVGGKTGVNHPAGKNLIGAFHQPRGVLADTATLTTLPEREFRSGLAEVFKYGLISDATFLQWLESRLEPVLARDATALAHLIRRSCEIKAQIVAGDEREQADRALLNFGHTFGHAIEAGTGFSQWLHGEAVAVGMLIAASLSARLGWLQPADVERVRQLLVRAGLPVSAPPIGAQRALKLMGLDKKVREGRIRLVLLRAVGAGQLAAEYDARSLEATLEDYFGP